MLKFQYKQCTHEHPDVPHTNVRAIYPCAWVSKPRNKDRIKKYLLNLGCKKGAGPSTTGLD